MKTTTCLLCLLLTAASGSAFAQKGGGGGNNMGNMPNMPAYGPDNPKANSDAEQALVDKMKAAYADAATTPEQMEQAIANLLTKYPKTDFAFQANRTGMQYFANPRHPDSTKVREYAVKALKYIHDDMYTIATAAEAVPKFETPDDPDLAGNLAFADLWNDKVLSSAKNLPGPKSRAPADVAKARQAKDQVLFTAYFGLARSATLRKDYPVAQQNYEKAIEVADFNPANTGLVRAETYLYMAQSQEEGKDLAGAAASLDQASKLDSGSTELQKAISAEQDKVKLATAGGH